MDGASSAARVLASRLELEPHPEGGFYKRIYESGNEFTLDDGRVRKYSTAIYFLLERGQYSAMHRIKSDELWHHYAGSTLNVHEIFPDGTYKLHRLGKDLSAGERPFCAVTAGSWFGADIPDNGSFALVGCTVSPGFDFEDFALADPKVLSETFPQHRALIETLAPKEDSP